MVALPATFLQAQVFNSATYTGWSFDGTDTCTSGVRIGGVDAGTASVTVTNIANFDVHQIQGNQQANFKLTELDNPTAGTQADVAFSVTPLAGWVVDGVSLLGWGAAVLSDPTYSNLIHDGVGSVVEDVDFFASHADGSPVASGSTLVANAGTTGNNGGWSGASQAGLWSVDSAGGTGFSFNFSIDHTAVNSVVDENIGFDTQLSQVPEPSAALLGGLVGASLLLRRRR